MKCAVSEFKNEKYTIKNKYEAYAEMVKALAVDDRAVDVLMQGLLVSKLLSMDY